MAINRTVLPRKGLVQPQHGLTGYEGDIDGNLSLLDANVVFSSDLVAAIAALASFALNGVVNGFTLSTSSSLTPGLAIGTLIAQGKVFSPGSISGLIAAPPSATSYLFYNFAAGYYWQSSAVGATAGDALIGQVVTSGSAVTAVTQATPIYGQVAAAPGAPGNFTLQHFLGRTPIGAAIQMTSGGAIWFQSTTMYDGTNLYLVASDAGVTAKVMVW